MYRQLLQQSQPPAGRPYGVRGRGGAWSGAGEGRGRIQDSLLFSGGRGGIKGGGRRTAGRFGFINAVMAHARDGGDPLDIEEACGSDSGGFTQDGYAGTPKATPEATPTQEKRHRQQPRGESQGAVGCPDWSPCDPMSSGESAQSSNG